MLERIGRYEVRRELGRGGMATVYLAFDPRIRRQVAIKVLPRQFTHDPRYLARFEQEAQTIATLEHAAIVPVHDFGEQDDAPYLVMRYMSGGSLQDRLSGEPLSLEEIALTLQRLAPVVDRAHSLGIIHRDLKPANILFDDEGKPYLADFGIARLAEASQTLTMVGTPAYMSPEQVQGDLELDGRSDIYALGVMLYDLLTGRQPYEADTPAKQMMAHILEPVPNVLEANPDLPPGAQEIIDKTMAKDREDRYATASELAAVVSQLAASVAATPQETAPDSAVVVADEDVPDRDQERAGPHENVEAVIIVEPHVEPLPDAKQVEMVDHPDTAEREEEPPQQDDSGGTAPPSSPPMDSTGNGGFPRWVLWAGALVVAVIAIYAIGTFVWPLITGTQTGGADKEGGYLDRAYNGDFSGTTVTILGFADHKDRFNAGVAEFEKATGIDIQYAGSSNNDDELFQHVEVGVAHDIVDFPVVNATTEIVAAGEVVDVTTFLPQKLLTERYDNGWLDMATMPGPDGEPMMAGVWHRFTSKSFVWYPKEEFEARGYAIPNNWDELSDLSHQIADDGGAAWCVGIESDFATGWVATDWTEDLLLRTASLATYDAWVGGQLPFDSDEIRNAIQLWGEIWFDPAFTYGGREYIANTSFMEVPKLLLEDPPRCWLHRQASWVTFFFPDDVQYGRDYGVFYLPPIDQSLGKPLLVSGNFMSMFNDREEVRAVMEYFTTPESTLAWTREGNDYSPHLGATPDMYGTDLSRDIAGIIDEATSFRYDGSDMMPGEVGAGSFRSGMTAYVLGEDDLGSILSQIDDSWPR